MNKKKFCKIFFPVLGTVAVVTGIYWALIEFSLKDLQNIGYISFRYEKNSATKASVAYITAINQDKNYPSYFEVPKQLKGHKVVGIDAQAFYGLDHLKTVVLPKSVTVIGDQAFGNCANLKKVIVKGELTSVGVDVFEGSDNWEYKSITDEYGDKFIMFEDFLYKYDGIIQNNTTIKSEDDKGKNEVASNQYLYIPSVVKELCSGSFKDQPGIVGVELPTKYTQLPKEVFANCKNLKSVDLKNVTEISDSAFENCNSLENIDLSKVTSIGSSAFNGTNISSITLSNELTSINNSTFANCSNLGNITIPTSVTRIDNYAFENDVNITEMVLSDNVNFLGVGAFKNTRIKTFKTPKLIQTIPSELFMGDTALESIELIKEEDMIQTKSIVYNEYDSSIVEQDEYGNTLYTYTYTGIQTIGNNAFNGCIKLTAIEFPYKTFEEDRYIGKDQSQKVPVEKSIVQIGESAFEGTGLIEFNTPITISRFERGMLKNCVNLTKVNFGNRDKNHKFTAINAECFAGDTSLESIVIPNDVTAMQASVFSGCSNLKNVSLPTNSSFKTLNNSIFEKCTSLTELVVPENVVTIKNSAFKGCNNLVNIQLLGKVSTIEKDAFASCDKLEKIFVGVTEAPKSGWLDGWNPTNAKVIYYSKTEKADCWHYDADNKVVLW